MICGAVFLYFCLEKIPVIQNYTIFEMPASISITGIILLLALFLGD